MARQWVTRCPKCGSTDARADEGRSAYDFTYMQCDACGHGELVDSWQRDADWLVEIDIPLGLDAPPPYVAPIAPGGNFAARLARSRAAPPAPTDGANAQTSSPPDTWGCVRCFGADAAVAWKALDTRSGAVLLHEPHLAVSVVRCDCGQAFAAVMTERIDREYGEDDLLMRWVPLRASEAVALETTPSARAASEVERFAEGRRHLAHHVVGASPRSWWIDGDFRVGPYG